MVDIPIPAVGSSAAFAFNEPFNTLDGVYRLAAVRPYDVAIADGVDLLENLYTTVYSGEDDEPETELASDLSDLIGQPVLQLVERNSTTPKTYYMPYAHLASVPDPQLVRAHSLRLVIDLGQFKDPAEISYLIGYLDDAAAAVTGTEKTTKLFSADTTWMTQSAYDTLVSERAADITGLDLLTKTNAAQALAISKKNTQIAALHAVIASLTS